MNGLGEELVKVLDDLTPWLRAGLKRLDRFETATKAGCAVYYWGGTWKVRCLNITVPVNDAKRYTWTPDYANLDDALDDVRVSACIEAAKKK